MLQTQRLKLRKFPSQDLDPLGGLMRNSQFMHLSLGMLSPEQTAGFLERIFAGYREHAPSQFAVIGRAENKLIGYCGFFRQTVDAIEEIGIGYRIDPAHWGQGIATEAARAVRDHAFTEPGLERVISLIHPDNVASCRVVEKIGMTIQKQTVFRGFPTIVFTLNAPEWKKLVRDA